MAAKTRLSVSVTDQPASVRQGEELSKEKLEAYLRKELRGTLAIYDIKQFPQGYSNLTYLIRTNERDFILRRPPFGANIKSAHDMGREFRVLSLLKRVYPKVPEPYLYCEDETVVGAPFYLMERVNGVILRNKPPRGISLTADLMRQLSEAAVDNLVALHAINIESSGLAQLGKPEGYVQRQVEGWIKRYYNAETDKIESMDEVAAWMQSNVPGDMAPAFIHNDYKYDNLVLNPDNLCEIIAVLDWEMATVGDPLMDIATTLGYWAEPGDHPFLREFSLTSLPGNLTRQQVVKRYAEKSGRDVSSILFYYVYACFKIGVIGQQIYARFVKGFTKDPRFAGLIHLVKACGGNGLMAIHTGRISNFN